MQIPTVLFEENNDQIRKLFENFESSRTIIEMSVVSEFNVLERRCKQQIPGVKALHQDVRCHLSVRPIKRMVTSTPVKHLDLINTKMSQAGKLGHRVL